MQAFVYDSGTLQQGARILTQIPKDWHSFVSQKGMRAAARVVVNEAKKNITFKSRHGSFGLAGTFGVVTSKNRQRVYANYGNRRNPHAHLIQFGTAPRTRGGKTWAGVKPHRILEKAFMAKQNEVVRKMQLAMERGVKAIIQKSQSGKISKALARRLTG